MKSKRTISAIDCEENTQEENEWPQILAILVGSLSGLTEGFFFSWTSPFIPQITEDKVNYDINEEQASFFNTIYPIGMLVGCLLFPFISDRIGRKRTFLLCVIPQILSWLLTAFNRDLLSLYVSRFCSGLSVACYFSVFPSYVGEIANPRVRGKWGNAITSSMYLGELAINIIGSYLGVKETSFVCLVLPVLFLTIFSFMPESPYYFIMKGKEEQAKNSMKILTRRKNVDKEYLKLKFDVDQQIVESGSWADLIKIKSNRRAIFAGLFLRLTQNTSGLGIFLQYTQSIFQRSGQNISKQLSSVIFMSLNLVLNLLVSFFVVHRFRRKILYMVSLVGTGVVLSILGTYFYIEDNFEVDVSPFNWIPVTGMVVYMIFSSCGLSVLPTLMISELFSASIKAKAMMLPIVISAVGSVIINTAYFYINESLGFFASFYFFAICNAVSVVISFFVIPETKGKTLGEIQRMLKMENMKDCS